MSVSPLNNFIEGLNAQYFTKAETIAALQSLSSLSLGLLFKDPLVSTLTVNPAGFVQGGALISTNTLQGNSLLVSSINGQTFGGSGKVQLNPTNAGVQSYFVPAQSSWSPFVSTSAAFSWTAGKAFDIGTNIGANVVVGPGNAGQLRMGIGLAGTLGNAQPNPDTVGNLKLLPSTNQTLFPVFTARTTIVPTTTDTGSIVAYLYPDQPDFQVSGQMTNSSNFPSYLQQIN